MGSDLIITLCVSRRGWGHQSGSRSIGCPEKAMEGRWGEWRPSLSSGACGRASSCWLCGLFGGQGGPQWARAGQFSGAMRLSVRWWETMVWSGRTGLACGVLPPRTAVAQSPAQFLLLLGASACAAVAEVRPMPSGARFVWSVARPLWEALARPPGSMVSCSGLGPGPREDHPRASHVPSQLGPPPRNSAPLPCPDTRPFLSSGPSWCFGDCVRPSLW